jgi:hypothetical protein
MGVTVNQGRENRETCIQIWADSAPGTIWYDVNRVQ